MNTSRDAWMRVGAAMKQRRRELRLSQAAAAANGDISEEVWQALETARRTTFSARTISGVETGLRWEPGSIERILDGDPPIPRRDQLHQTIEGKAEDWHQLARIATRSMLEMRWDFADVARIANVDEEVVVSLLQASETRQPSFAVTSILRALRFRDAALWPLVTSGVLPAMEDWIERNGPHPTKMPESTFIAASGVDGQMSNGERSALSSALADALRLVLREQGLTAEAIGAEVAKYLRKEEGR